MTARSTGKTLLLWASFFLLLMTTDVLAQKPPDWILVGKGGCVVWNASPRPGDSASWTGVCVAGPVNGAGTLQWFQEGRPADRFEGEFRDGLMEGRGTYVWAGGDRYVGQFHTNLRNGQGAMSFVNGDRYDGDYRDGRQEGRGIYVWSDGRRYVGEFKDDKLVKGVLSLPNGDRYDGFFFDSRPQGQGQLIFADGAAYQGEWKQGRPNGEGTHRTSDGRIFTGTWTNGCFRQGTRWDAVAATPKECGFR